MQHQGVSRKKQREQAKKRRMDTADGRTTAADGRTTAAAHTTAAALTTAGWTALGAFLTEYEALHEAAAGDDGNDEGDGEIERE
jgi:hypothetical protein